VRVTAGSCAQTRLSWFCDTAAASRRLDREEQPYHDGNKIPKSIYFKFINRYGSIIQIFCRVRLKAVICENQLAGRH
jgi:hypothetical protein